MVNHKCTLDLSNILQVCLQIWRNSNFLKNSEVLRKMKNDLSKK